MADANNLLSEFFYEGIRRIIPGLVVVILYWHTEAVTVFRTHHLYLHPYLFIACILVIAWLFGFIVEAPMFGFFRFFLRCVGRNKYTKCNLTKFLCWFHMLENSEVSKHTQEMQRRIYFDAASKTMCRCLWLIFFFASFVHHPETFVSLPCPHSWYCICFLVFLVAWICLSLPDEKPNKSPEPTAP
jgi:hypothetical protein